MTPDTLTAADVMEAVVEGLVVGWVIFVVVMLLVAKLIDDIWKDATPGVVSRGRRHVVVDYEAALQSKRRAS